MGLGLKPLLIFFAHLILLIDTTAAQESNVNAMFLLGDSSVDCGFNTLFYPLLHRNFSLLPCDANATSSLLPFLLGSFLNPSFLDCFFYFLVYNIMLLFSCS